MHGSGTAAYDDQMPRRSEEKQELRKAAWKEQGQRLLTKMTFLGMASAELARRMGTHPSTVSNAINGNRGLSQELLPLAAEALGVTTDYLLTGKQPGVSTVIQLPTSPLSGSLPPGLKEFVEGHADELSYRDVQDLSESRFRAEPSRLKEDAFWWDLLKVLRKYRDAEGGEDRGQHPPDGRPAAAKHAKPNR